VIKLFFPAKIQLNGHCSKMIGEKAVWLADWLGLWLAARFFSADENRVLSSTHPGVVPYRHELPFQEICLWLVEDKTGRG
jgi:hypothetical protein